MEIMSKKKKEGAFGVVGGFRLGGKTTLAGTLPGKTKLLYANLLETGYKAALALAKKRGNKLEEEAFVDLSDLVAKLAEAADSDVDNIYIDGISAVCEMKMDEEEVKKASKKSVWDGYFLLAQATKKLILLCKEISEKTGKVIFVTLPYKSKLNANGDIVKVEADILGNATINSITKYCPIVLAVDTEYDEDGNGQRILYTASTEQIPARVDHILEEDNPRKIKADFVEVFKLLGLDV
jgi:hypothetical protein